MGSDEQLALATDTERRFGTLSRGLKKTLSKKPTRNNGLGHSAGVAPQRLAKERGETEIKKRRNIMHAALFDKHLPTLRQRSGSHNRSGPPRV